VVRDDDVFGGDPDHFIRAAATPESDLEHALPRTRARSESIPARRVPRPDGSRRDNLREPTVGLTKIGYNRFPRCCGSRNLGGGLGRRLFTDGATRQDLEDADGGQWVTGPDGERVYGNWILTKALVDLTPIVAQASDWP
jgi:hypothetical protein